MKIAIVILLALLVLAVILAIVISGRPDKFRYERAATISAPPERVFAHVNDLHRWEEWSPWAKLDPNSKSTFDGPPAGVGASMAWAGNKQVGEGRMTILESEPSRLIRIRLEFFKPFKATNMAEFTFQPEGAQTVVRWAMYGDNTLMGKAMGLVIDCDKMLGKSFEQGLAQLKAVSEGAR